MLPEEASGSVVTPATEEAWARRALWVARARQRASARTGTAAGSVAVGITLGVLTDWSTAGSVALFIMTFVSTQAAGSWQAFLGAEREHLRVELEELGQEEREDVLLRLRHDESPVVRQIAESAIRRKAMEPPQLRRNEITPSPAPVCRGDEPAPTADGELGESPG